jgi:iturin family lipopeptide synthetase B
MENIPLKKIEDILALTPMQEAMLFHHLRNPQSEHYFEQLSLGVHGKIDLDFFEKTWNLLVENNEMLRAFFRWENIENPIQIIFKEHKVRSLFYDFSTEENHRKKKSLEEVKERDRQQKFDLRYVPFRVSLCKMAEEEYEMIISNHHILYDGWSTGIILEEFFWIYTHLWKGIKTWELPAKTKFKTFVQWLQSQDTQKQRKFWEEYLKDCNHHQTNKENDVKKKKRGEIACIGDYIFQLPAKVKDQLERFLKEHHITMASFFFSVWGILLQHYNSSNDVLFDTTVSGRNPGCLKGVENIVGLFINTLPLRANTYTGEKIGDFLNRMNLMLERWGEFTNSSLFVVNEYRNESWDQYLFDSVLVIENYPLDRILKQENRKPDAPISIESFSISGNANYDLTTIVTPFDDIKVNFTYNKNLFNKDSMSKLSTHFTYVLEEILNHPGKSLEKMALEMPVKLNHDIEIFSENKTREASKTIGLQAPDNIPADTVEEELQWIWEEVLGKKPAPDDNFFDISGNSIALIRIYKQINQLYPGKIKVNDFFRIPTIRGLKELLTSPHKETLIKEKKKIRNINF